MDGICKASDSVEISSVETTAYLRALGDQKGLDMGKYRDQVKKEMRVQRKSKPDGIKFELTSPFRVFLDVLKNFFAGYFNNVTVLI